MYLASAKLDAAASILGKLPTTNEYMEYTNVIDSMSKDVYRHLNFDQMAEYQDVTDTEEIPAAQAG